MASKKSPTDLLGNSAWNAIAFGVAVALNLVVLPFVVFRLGVAAFGVAGLVTACAAPALAFSNADAADNGVINPARKTLPAAGLRNIFTYLGGSITKGSGLGPNNVLQTGWKAVDIDHPSVDPAAGCLDKFHIGEINSTTKPDYTGPPYAGMLPGPDGVCDLQEALELTPVSSLFVDTSGNPDHGTANGVSGGSIPTAFLNDNLNAKEFAQMVRGYCYATDPVTGSFVSGRRINWSSARCRSKNPLPVFGSAPKRIESG